MIRALLLAGLLSFAGPAAAQDPGRFTIAGELFAPDDIVDARAIPEPDGTAGVMVTLAESAAKRLEALTIAHRGKPVVLALDGATLSEPVVREPIPGGVLTIVGRYSVADAEALARRISGKDPLPDEFAE